MAGWLSRIAGALRRRSEERRFRGFDPVKLHRFWIVSCGHGAAEFIERHLDSVHSQKYSRDHFAHLVIDDASTDGAAARAESWRRRHPEARLEIVSNAERRGGCRNYTDGFRRGQPGDIVLQVDTDDWLPDENVLAFLNMIYHDSDVWMTYNSWVLPDGRRGVNCWPIGSAVVERNGYREHEWISSHLHSFRRPLFDHVLDESLIDPTTGEFWTSAVDQAQFLPMMELAGRHARHLERACYVYNLGSQSIVMGSRRAEQEAAARRIRSMKAYVPLDRLDAGEPTTR
jgi:glycosyltransferase involved in cell wall biosynthesis